MEDGCTGEISINSSLIFGVSSLNADHDTSYVIRGWLSCFICIFGLIGNLLSVVVLTRPSLRILPINVILSFLTVCNSVYILLYLVSWSIPTIIARMEMGESENGNVKWNNYFMTQWRPQHYPYLYPLLWTAQNTSIGFTILLTLERYIYVCKPLESSKIMTHRKTVLVSLLTTVLFIIYELPLWWRFESVRVEITNCTTGPALYIIQNTIHTAHPLMRAYRSKIKILVLHYLIPLVVLFTLNCWITSALKSIEIRKKRMPRSEEKNASYTKIVICVISLSCLTDVVFAVVTVVDQLRDAQHELYSQVAYTLLKDITDLLLLINASINFLFYCLFGTAFRQEFFRLFCPFDCTKSLAEPQGSEIPLTDSVRRQRDNED